jgi:hypothetical protein
MSFNGKRAVREYTHLVDAPPGEVFPLLCPVRERDWIPGWTAEVVYSESGVAELDGVFVAGRDGAMDSTFFVVRYEPPWAVDYLVHQRQGFADRLALSLAAGGQGQTTLRWFRVFTGLTPEGNALVDAAAAAFEVRVPQLAAWLDGHVRQQRVR